MEDIIKIRLTLDYINVEEKVNEITKLYSSIVDHAVNIGIWEDSIKAIIITDNFTGEIEKQATEWKIKTFLSNEKDYSIASKVLFNHNLENPEYHIFIDIQYFFSNLFPHDQIALGQILSISATKIIPKEIREFTLTKEPVSFDEHIKFVSSSWCKAVYTRTYLSKLFGDSLLPMNHNTFLTAFKRKLKRYLFDYNSDHLDENQRLAIFWHDYFESINCLFLRIIENECNVPELKIKNDEPSKDLVYKVVMEIRNLTIKCLENNEYDIKSLCLAIQEFSAHFEVIIHNEKENSFCIKLTKDPREYFIDEIIETEPRIVCFMDILGFSDLINEYDSNIKSTILQDIQESFAMAKRLLLEDSKTNRSDILKHLKYKTFSDNICISIPYFDNELDFLTNFNLLTIYVRGFHFIMMSKGIFMRGGISIGSYYDDSNIIFSKGLVNAYYLESKKAIYPRIIIDNIIINKFQKYSTKQIQNFGLDNIILFDWENTAFLSPFGIISSSFHSLETFFNGLNQEEKDSQFELMDTFTKSLGNLTIDLIKNLSIHEKKELIPIKNFVNQNIIIHRENENIVSKYLWLNEFIKWYENDNSGKLIFQKFWDVMNKK